MNDSFYDFKLQEAVSKILDGMSLKEAVSAFDLTEDANGEVLSTLGSISNPLTSKLSFTRHKKAANEAKGGDKYLSLDDIKTSPVVKRFFADSSLVRDFYNFMSKWDKDSEAYYKKYYENLEYEPLEFSIGKSYIKVIRKRSVRAFIDKFGNVYKPAGWNAPTKGVRYYISDYNRIHFDPHGGFLYGNRNLVPKTADSYASETEVGDDLGESRSINEKLYSFDEVQDMVTDCHKDAKLKKRVLAELPAGGPLGKKDKAAISRVIDSGFADTFERYDSAVADNFIGAYLSAKGIDEAIVHPCRKNNGDLLRGIGTDRKSLTDSKETSYQEYKGYDISYNLYGGGEYTVQFDGDDVVFDTEKEAKDFIDSQVSGDGLDESYNGFDYFDIDVDFKKSGGKWDKKF